MNGLGSFLGSAGCALVLLFGPGFAEPAAYGSLQRWEGYYPTKYANTLALPAGQTFWDDPLIKRALAATLTPDQLKMLVGCWGTGCEEERIQLYDNMIAVHVCKKDARDFRACQAWGAYLFVEMDSGRTSVCWNMVTAGDLEPEPSSLWIWHNPSGDAGTVSVDGCTSASAFQHVIDQKNGTPPGPRAPKLPVAKLHP